jgi:hypothetical protein
MNEDDRRFESRSGAFSEVSATSDRRRLAERATHAMIAVGSPHPYGRSCLTGAATHISQITEFKFAADLAAAG